MKYHLTTLLELVHVLLEEGAKATTIITCIVLYRKHLSNKRMRRDIELIKMAVGVGCPVDSLSGKNELQRIVGQTKKLSSQQAAYAHAIIAKYFTRSEVTYPSKQRRMNMKSKLLSRKFLLAISTGILIALNDALGWGLDQGTINSVCTVVVGYIAGEAVTDIAKVNASKKNGMDEPGDTGPAV